MDSKTETLKPRFASDILFASTDAELKHFQPVDGIRDRFGNRIFTSNDLAYRDREGDQVKAALLVSQEGERFIKNHPGILNKIGEAICKWGEHVKDGRIGNQLQIDLDTKLTYLGGGSQSHAHLLQIGNEYIVVKTRSARADLIDRTGLTQPYINEMLQTQSIAKDLKIGLAEIGIGFPRFLFASGQVSCVRFEQGHEPSEKRINKVKNDLFNLIENYIKRRRENDLWKNIYADMVAFGTNKPRVDDIIEKNDGGLVFIDPFIYQTERPTKFQRLKARIFYMIEAFGHD